MASGSAAGSCYYRQRTRRSDSHSDTLSHQTGHNGHAQKPQKAGRFKWLARHEVADEDVHARINDLNG